MVAAQDDAREREMRNLFNLEVPPDRRRADIDAHLEVDGVDEPLNFELKSSTKRSISTVRDLGPDHIAKWRHLHWLFGFYDGRGERLEYCIYASPADMRPWVDTMEAYIRPDLVLAERAPLLISDDVLTEVAGNKASFSLAEAKAIMKLQWKAAEYKANADLAGSMYSRERMLALLRERCEYVIRRGATLNNPHVPARFFKPFDKITKNHAATLRTLVQQYLDNAAQATAEGNEPPEGETDPIIEDAAGDGSD